MIGLSLLIGLIIYILLSILIVWKSWNLVSNKMGRVITRCITLFLVLWLPVTEHATSYVVYKVYANEHAGPKIFRTVHNVDRIHLDNGMRPGTVAIRWNKEAFSVGREDRNSMAYDYVEYEKKGKTDEESYESGYNGRIILPESKSQYFISEGYVVKTRYYYSFEYKIYDKTGDVLAHANMSHGLEVDSNEWDP